MSKVTLAPVQKLSSNPKITVPVSFTPITPTDAVKPGKFFSPEQTWKNEFKKKFEGYEPGLLIPENKLDTILTDFIETLQEKLPFIIVAIIAILIMVISVYGFVK